MRFERVEALVVVESGSDVGAEVFGKNVKGAWRVLLLEDEDRVEMGSGLFLDDEVDGLGRLKSASSAEGSLLGWGWSAEMSGDVMEMLGVNSF